MKIWTATSAQLLSTDGKTFQRTWQLYLAKRAIREMIELPEGATRESGLVKDLLFTPDELTRLSGILNTDYRVIISAEELQDMTLGQLADRLPERQPFRITV